MDPEIITYSTEKSFCVDLPVRVMIWTRPDLQLQQFKAIQAARPSILFLVSDGGRTDEENALIEASRLVFEGIDWSCTVHRLFFNENQGMYSVGKIASEYIWNQVDRLVLLEDDIIPSIDYFRFCDVLLEKYKNDQRILGICGMNHLGVSSDVDSDYFFSQEASIWGMAIWKRTFLDRDYSYSYQSSECRLINNAARINPDFRRRLKGYASSDYYEGHIAGPEFWYAFDVFAQNQLYIVPKYNLISNRGCTSRAAHSDELKLLPKGIRHIFDMQTHPITFPLNHPRFVTPNVNYQKSVYRIMAVGHPLILTARRVSRALRILIYRGPSDLFKKINLYKHRDES